MPILKRQFTARNETDKEKRRKLNEDALTSKYLPSYKYLYKSEVASLVFKTKKEAEKFASSKD